MFKRLRFSLGQLLILTLLVVAVCASWNQSSVDAAGRMIVPPEERVNLQIDSEQLAESYKWTVTDRQNNIVYVSEGRFFSYVFKDIGSYTINVSATDQNTQEISHTKIEVAVGTTFADARPDASAPVDATVIRTTPAADANNVIHLSQGGGDITFYATPIEGIKTFEVDQDLSEDTNIDLNPANDIDNSADVLVKPYTSFYRPRSGTVQAKVTVVDANNQRLEEVFTIAFDRETLTLPPPKIVLVTVPDIADDKKIHLDGTPASVSFDLSASEGDIIEYRIDANIFEDSDGNGNPDDDIDNLNHDSFKTGLPFEVNYQDNGEAIIAQITVVSSEGKGSQIQRAIVFGAGLPFRVDFKSAIAEMFAGEEVFFDNLTEHPAQLEMAYGWDFDGDGTLDAKTQNRTVSHTYDTPGEYTVKLFARDKAGNFDSVSKTIFVQDPSGADLPFTDENKIQPTIADFSFTAEGAEVRFQNLSQPSPDLIDPTLEFMWTFGDGKSGSGSSPVHSYNESGTYIVELAVTDTAGEVKKRSQEITIEATTDTGAVVTPDVTPDVAEPDVAPDTPSDPLWWTLLKWLLFFIIFLIALAVLGVGGGIIYLKIQHPDFTMGEAWQELQEKVLGRQPTVPSEEEALPVETPKIEAIETTAVEEPVVEETPTEPETPVENAPLAGANTEAPSWLKKAMPAEGTEVTPPSETPVEETPPAEPPVEPEAPAEPVEEKPAEEAPAEAPTEPVKDTGPLVSEDELPDWLKPASTEEKPAAETPVTTGVDDDDWLLDEDLDLLGDDLAEPEAPAPEPAPSSEAPVEQAPVEETPPAEPPVEPESPAEPVEEKPAKESEASGQVPAWLQEGMEKTPEAEESAPAEETPAEEVTPVDQPSPEPEEAPVEETAATTPEVTEEKPAEEKPKRKRRRRRRKKKPETETPAEEITPQVEEAAATTPETTEQKPAEEKPKRKRRRRRRKKKPETETPAENTPSSTEETGGDDTGPEIEPGKLYDIPPAE